MLPTPSSEARRSWLAVALPIAALAWAFGPILMGMAERWQNDSRYTHGWLVPLFSLYLLWVRRADLELRPSWWGLPVLLAALAAGAVGTYGYFDWLSAVGLVGGLVGLTVTLAGWRGLAVAWPALAFLLFMVPLPYRLEVGLAHPLQRVATVASTLSLQTLGFAAFAEGNTIRMGEVRIGVVEACSGLSMLMIFFALCTAVAMLLRRPLWERLLVVACAVPIALAANIIRIVVTGVLHKVAGRELADLVFHDLAGWLMMPLALGILWLGHWLFSWAFPIRSRSEDEPVLLYGPAPTAPPA
ncbi:MAG: exosortase/archaeosortase family protein [Gemmataceae bacterium]